MAKLLEKLGVPKNVRLFFKPYFTVLPDGSLLFPFGEDFEHFGRNFHRIPLAIHPWVAGNGLQLFYSYSAMEAIAFLALHAHRFPNLDQLRFVATGCLLNELPRFAFQKCSLLFGNDLYGRLNDIHYATTLRNQRVQLRYEAQAIHCSLPQKRFVLPVDKFSLHAFEQAAGLRSGIRTYKPRAPFHNFLQQLTHAYETHAL